MKAEEYLSVLTDQMRCKMAREAVRDELLCHIEDQKAAFISEGMEKSEAEEAAVREMGDPVETGNEMDRIHRPKMAWGMIALITVLSITGYAIQRAMEAKVVADGGYAWLSSRNLVFLIAGLVLMMGVCFADYTRIGQRARGIMAVIDILLIGATVFSRAVNGAKTFLYLPVIGYITIEYVFLLTVPVYAAILYGYRGQGYRAIGKAVLWMIPSAFIAFRIPNIMTTAVLMLSYMIILGIAVFHGWFRVSRRRTLAGIAAALLCAPAAGIAFYWFMGEDYQRERLRVILDPGSTEAGYVPGLIRGLIENSRLAGSGAAVPDTSVIPQFQTFILSGVTVYYGMLAAAVLAGLILFLLIRFLRISLRQRNQLGMLMGAGCSVVFLVETAVYILNNLGVVYTSSYCPFLSCGGTGTLITYILLGILLSICRYQNTAPERKRLPGISRKPV